MANSYLQRTPSSTGNRRKWTFSCWLKRSKIVPSGDQQIFSATGGGSTVDEFKFQNDKLKMVNYNGSSNIVTLRTTRVFRDTSAWYHIVLQADTDNATSTERWKLYVNGEQVSFDDETSFGTQNLDTYVNSTNIHRIGTDARSPANHMDGYFAHIHFTDGSLYGPSTFGQTDSTTGIWKPILAPSVTYGTNGFFLKFASSGSLGTDSSGNSHTWSVNGNMKQSQTTPSNVFCKPNQLDYAGSVSQMEKNGLRLNNTGGAGDVAARSTQAVKSGKWYYECKSTISDGHGNRKMVGFVDVESPVNNPRTLTSNAWKGIVMDLQTGNVYKNASTSGVTNVSAFSTGDIVQVYFDADNGDLRLGKNGTVLNSGNAVATGLDMTYFYTPYNCQDGGGSNNGVMDYNFGEGTFGGIDVASSNSDANGYGLFEYDPTLSGTEYYALCTKNIKEYG